MHILYVDDHQKFRSIVIKQFLAAHRVTVASTLAEARILLKDGSFDAVLLDFDLPDGKGTELMEELRHFGLFNCMIAVSSMENNNARLLAAGAFAAVGKMEFSRIGEALERLQKKTES